jgi:hypothetical protein
MQSDRRDRLPVYLALARSRIIARGLEGALMTCRHLTADG